MALIVSNVTKGFGYEGGAWGGFRTRHTPSYSRSARERERSPNDYNCNRETDEAENRTTGRTKRATHNDNTSKRTRGPRANDTWQLEREGSGPTTTPERARGSRGLTTTNSQRDGRDTTTTPERESLTAKVQP